MIVHGAARPFEVFRDNLRRLGARADGNLNASDFLWALDETIEQLRAADATEEQHEAWVEAGIEQDPMGGL